LIAGATDPMVNVLNKDREATFVVIDDVDTDNRGHGGEAVTERRRRAASLASRGERAGDAQDGQRRIHPKMEPYSPAGV